LTADTERRDRRLLQVSSALAAKAAALGVRFTYGSIIRGLDVEGGHVTGVVTAHGRLEADAVVVALGSFSPLLVRPHGIRG
jgi:D-amino-acid dehydrogenase